MDVNTQKIAEIIKTNRSGENFTLEEVMEIALQSYKLGIRASSENVIKIIRDNPLKWE